MGAADVGGLAKEAMRRAGAPVSGQPLLRGAECMRSCRTTCACLCAVLQETAACGAELIMQTQLAVINEVSRTRLAATHGVSVAHDCACKAARQRMLTRA